MLIVRLCLPRVARSFQLRALLYNLPINFALHCWSVGGGRNTRESEKKTSEQDENQEQAHALMTPGPGIETAPHWWEARAPTTAPSRLIMSINNRLLFSKSCLHVCS